jgi:hypothetical protein
VITIADGDLVLSCDGGDLRIKEGHTERFMADPENPANFELVQACTNVALPLSELHDLAVHDAIRALRGLAVQDTGWMTGIPDEFATDGMSDYCPHHLFWADARLGLVDPDERTLHINPEGWVPAWAEEG